MFLSPLKIAFSEARATSNIDLVAPVFIASRLFVIGKTTPLDRDPVFYLTKSRNLGRFCVTVSESSDRFRGLSEITLIKISGSELLKRMSSKQELIIVYEDGGDFLSAEQLNWIRQQQNEK
jgi:hypothetical protein